MISGKLIVVRGTANQSEDWGEYEFLALPSPADRVMVQREGAENYATVLAVHHYPRQAGSSDDSTIEIVAKWTGSGPRIR
ncbi:hypothetical protein P7228_12165 [Altererythrobacter arenosus]|uniref:Uncharacterized protein n=1 Tax=Altererythrobacter arenosus TaxID=3032592 RepID=A0ABY8FUD7_9SPHN|nr:hypothetical protein [Altererythrobacter sp. CAU 1644]WFL76746.1 hypothetical protein P7228_12165 [Altererythrobacter sp. CAU 1644]